MDQFGLLYDRYLSIGYEERDEKLGGKKREMT
jgi:hypothetical protein